jgi:hypothetical protein
MLADQHSDLPVLRCVNPEAMGRCKNFLEILMIRAKDWRCITRGKITSGISPFSVI